jgi:hypothetical protein
MIHWKVIEQVGGQVCALGESAGEGRPAPGETLLWEGEAVHNGAALLEAKAQNPTLDLVRLHRIRPGCCVYHTETR